MDLARRLIRAELVPRAVELHTEEDGRPTHWRCSICGVVTEYTHSKYNTAVKAKHSTFCDLGVALGVKE